MDALLRDSGRHDTATTTTPLPATELQEVRTEAYQDFLDTDVEIKELLLDTPPLRDDFLAARRLLDRHMTVITSRFETLAEALRVQEGVTDMVAYSIGEQAETLQQKARRRIDGQTQVSEILQSYHEQATNMRHDFVEQVAYHMTPYTSLENGKAFLELVYQADSYNELLFLAHSFAGQNELILQGLSQWGEHSISTPSSVLPRAISAVGTKTTLAEEIFEELKGAFEEVDSDIITIFSNDDAVQVMVRDYGHALTLVIEPNSDLPPHVRFRIPKTFGEESVAHIRGLSDHNDRYGIARGFFALEEGEALGPALVDFILSVPTDSDYIPRMD